MAPDPRVLSGEELAYYEHRLTYLDERLGEASRPKSWYLVDVRELLARIVALEKQRDEARDCYQRYARDVVDLERQVAEARHTERRADGAEQSLMAAWEENRAALGYIERIGHRRCDVAACNCGSWHAGVNSAETRLRERAEEAERQLAERMSENLAGRVRALEPIHVCIQEACCLSALTVPAAILALVQREVRRTWLDAQSVHHNTLHADNWSLEDCPEVGCQRLRQRAVEAGNG